MAEQVFKLSATARTMLTLAADREDRLVRPPQLPIVAARQVVRSLLNHGFVEEVPASIDHPTDAWRTTGDGAVLVLRATNQGMAAIGEAVDAPAPEQAIIEPAEFTGSTQVVSDRGQQTPANQDQAQFTEDQQAANEAAQPETATESPTAPHAAARDAGAAEAIPETEGRPEASRRSEFGWWNRQPRSEATE